MGLGVVIRLESSGRANVPAILTVPRPATFYDETRDTHESEITQRASRPFQPPLPSTISFTTATRTEKRHRKYLSLRYHLTVKRTKKRRPLRAAVFCVLGAGDGNRTLYLSFPVGSMA